MTRNLARSLSRRNLTRAARRAALAGTAVAASLAVLLGATPAQAATLVWQGTSYCWPASGGVALMQVLPPTPRPNDVYQPPGTQLIGDNSQDVRYRPYIQVWSGTTWVTVLAGPVYYGNSATFATTWYGATGGTWMPTVAAQRKDKLYYRSVAEVWWVADSTHAGAHQIGVQEQQQFRNGYWTMVSYCTY